MTRFTKFAFAAVAFSFALSFVPTAEACGRGRGYSSGNPTRRPNYNFSGGRSHSSYRPAPVVSRPVVTQPTGRIITSRPAPQTIVTPSPQSPIAQPAPVQTAPVQTAPIQTAAPVQPAPQPAATPNALDAALQALGGFAPAPTTQPAPAQPQHVGTFQANLGNGAKVELTLSGNGQFVWAATNADGRTSSFSGSYNVGGESLTLVRGNDSQQLAGSMTGLGVNGFQFKIGDGAALSFVRG